MKNWIYVSVIVVILIILGIGWVQYNKLEKSYQEYKIQNQEYIQEINNLNLQNEQKQHIIDSISLNIAKLNKEIELLNKDKNQLKDQLNQFEISADLIEGVIKLRENIWKHSQ